MSRRFDHDIQTHIVALLLNLALLAEYAASERPSIRAEVFSILLPAHSAALTLLDSSADPIDPEMSRRATLAIDDKSSERLLTHIATSFRLIAMLVYAGLFSADRDQSVAPASCFSIAAMVSLAMTGACRRNLRGIAPDTS